MNSQGNDDTSQILKQALLNTRNKQEEQRRALQNQYEQELLEIRKHIDVTFQEHDERAEKLRMDQANRLANLLKKKIDIEEKMAESIEALRVAYDRTCVEVLTVVNDRLNELEKEMTKEN